MKNKVKMFTMLLMGLIIGMVVSVAPTTSAEKNKFITIEKQEVDMVINGRNTTERPIVIYGTSYLPVRLIANALGFDVQWDQEAKLVTITTDVGVE